MLGSFNIFSGDALSQTLCKSASSCLPILNFEEEVIDKDRELLALRDELVFAILLDFKASSLLFLQAKVIVGFLLLLLLRCRLSLLHTALGNELPGGGTTVIVLLLFILAIAQDGFQLWE